MTEDNFSQVVNYFLVMRSSLEPQACALAAINGSGEQKAALASTMEEMKALRVKYDREKWVDVDTTYHEQIYVMSGNPFLSSFANLFRSIYYNYFSSIANNEVIKLDSHQAIVDAIIANNSQLAYTACQALLAEDK